MARIFKTKLYLHSNKDSNYYLTEEWDENENGICTNCGYLYTHKERNDPYCQECGRPTDLKNTFQMSEEAVSSFRYCLYEVELDAEIDLDTGETWITRFEGKELSEKAKVC